MKSQSLQRLIKIWTIIIIVVPSLLIMAIYTVSQIQEAKKQNLQMIGNLVHYQSRLIDYWMQERLNDVRVLSQLETSKKIDKQMIQAFDIIQKHNKYFDSLSYIDKDGIFRITTLKEGIKYPSAIGKPYFEAARAGKEYVSDVVIGRNSGRAIINFSTPIYDNAGNFQGLILGSVTTTKLEVLLRENWIGQTGEVFLVNRQGVMLTEPRFINILISRGLVKDSAKMKFKITNDAFRNIRLGQSGTAAWTDYLGNKVLGAYLDVPKQQWTIIGKINEAEVLAPIYKQLSVMAFCAFFLVLLILPLVRTITNRLNRPIEWLIKKANLIGSEDYRLVGRNIPPGKIPRELRKLCETFINMSGKIEHSVNLLKENEQNLERKVQQIQDVNTTLENEITKRQLVQTALEKQLFRDKFVVTQSTRLAKSKLNTVGRVIKLTLADIGRYTNASVCFAYHSFGEKDFKLRYYWYRNQIRRDELEAVTYLRQKEYPWLFQQLNNYEQVYIHVEELPEEASKERQLLHAAQLKKVFLLPVTRDQQLIGILGVAGNEFLRLDDHPSMMKILSESVLGVIERQQVFKELSKREEVNRVLIESIPDLMFNISSTGKILAVKIDDNQSLGISDESQLVGRHLSEILPTDAAELFKKAIIQALEQVNQQIIEYSIVDDKVIKYCETRIVPTRNNSVLAVTRDITEQKKAKQALSNVRDAITHAQHMASLGVIAGSIAHEINQPLNSIKLSASGLLFLMQKGTAIGPEDYQRELARIVRESERIEHEVNKTRGIARQGFSHKEPVLLDDVIAQTLPLLKDKTIFEEIIIQVQNDRQKSWIMGSHTQLEQVLLHLLTNAAQALYETKLAKKIISISVQTDDKAVLLSVADNGPGLKQSAEEIFEPFYTTKHTEDNMGLGLSIVKSIIYAHGGQITAINNEWGGATFRLSFPLLNSNNETKEEP